jgi:hypothetical protein
VTVRNRKLVSANELIFWPAKHWAGPRAIASRSSTGYQRTCRPSFPEVEGFGPVASVIGGFSQRLGRTSQFCSSLLQKCRGVTLWSLLDRVKESEVQEWYLRAALQNGWSRNVLVRIIFGQLREREGKALTNFQRESPPPESDLAEQILKDPYNFGFLTVTATAKEREIENGLLSHRRGCVCTSVLCYNGFSCRGSLCHTLADRPDRARLQIDSVIGVGLVVDPVAGRGAGLEACLLGRHGTGRVRRGELSGCSGWTCSHQGDCGAASLLISGS